MNEIKLYHRCIDPFVDNCPKVLCHCCEIEMNEKENDCWVYFVAIRWTNRLCIYLFSFDKSQRYTFRWHRFI